MKTENLTTKEQAEKLVRKYYTFGLNNTAQSFSWYECKECAKIAVDTIIESDCLHYPEDRLYWKSVRKELDILNQQEEIAISEEAKEFVNSLNNNQTVKQQE